MSTRAKHLPRLCCALHGLLPLETRRGPAVDLPLRRRPGPSTLRAVVLCEIRSEIPPTSADAADDVLLETGGERWTVLEDAIARRAWIVGIFPGETEAREAWRQLAPVLADAGVVPGDPAVRTLAAADWRDSYKAHFHAWQFGRLHWVPVWEREKFRLPPGDAVLWLDPGLAFGTGNHETTRLCVERLVALAEEFGVANEENSKLQTSNSKLRGPRVIDAGCGSGILALSAALLGFGDVTGFDNDPEAVRVSQENAAFNGLADRVTFFTADLTTGLARGPADIVLANIQADVLQRFGRELVSGVAPGGALVLSGILAGENAEVRATFEALTPGWTTNARIMGEWSDVVLRRPKG